VSDRVDGVGMPKAVGVHVLADEFPVSLDKLPGPLLGYGKEGHIARDVVTSHIVAQAANWASICAKNSDVTSQLNDNI